MQKPITKQEVELMQKGDSVVRLIDIRAPSEYEKQHVPGAVNIPAERLTDELSDISKDETIITVCTYGKERSQHAAELLYKAGFGNIFYLEGGTTAWCKDEPA